MTAFTDYTAETVCKLADKGFTNVEISKMTGVRIVKVVTILKSRRPPLVSTRKQGT